MSQLKYFITVSKLRGKISYYGRVVMGKTLGIDEIVKRIVGRGSTLTETDVYAVLNALTAVIASSLLDGFRVRLPFANYWLGVDGSFDSPDGSWQEGRHSIVGRSGMGGALGEEINKKAKMTKTRNKQFAELDQIVCSYTEIPNQILTLGDSATLSGDAIKFDKKDPKSGVFFVTSEGEAIRARSYPQVSAKKVIISLPELEVGQEYTVQLRSRKSPDEKLKIAELEETVRVLNPEEADAYLLTYEAEERELTPAAPSVQASSTPTETLADEPEQPIDEDESGTEEES